MSVTEMIFMNEFMLYAKFPSPTNTYKIYVCKKDMWLQYPFVLPLHWRYLLGRANIKLCHTKGNITKNALYACVLRTAHLDILTTKRKECWNVRPNASKSRFADVNCQVGMLVTWSNCTHVCSIW